MQNARALGPQVLVHGGEFTTMHEDLRAKRASILHSEMPSELIANSEPEEPFQARSKHPPTTAVIDVDVTPKKAKLIANKSTWNPKLRDALTVPLAKAGQPTFTKIMQFCKKDAYGIFPKGSPVCAPNAFFGTCFFGEKCTKKHTPATEAQVPPILNLLSSFINNPAKIKLGQ